MAYTLVQSTASTLIAPGPGTVDFSSPVTPGNLIVVYALASYIGFTPTFSATDNQAVGNSYAVVEGEDRAGFKSAILYAYDINVGSGTFTITVDSASPSPNGIILEAQEWSGFGSLNPLFASGASSGGGFPTACTASPNTIAPDALICAACCTANFNSAAPEAATPSWNTVYNYGGFTGRGDYRVVSASGVQEIIYDCGGGTSLVIAVFQDPGGFSAVRQTQIARGLVTQTPSTSVRLTQVVQGILAQTPVPTVRLTQVVQVLITKTTIAPGPVIIENPTNTSLWKLLRLDMKKREEEES